MRNGFDGRILKVDVGGFERHVAVVADRLEFDGEVVADSKGAFENGFVDEAGDGFGEVDEDAIIDNTVNCGEIGLVAVNIICGTISIEIVDDGIPVVRAGLPGGRSCHLDSSFGGGRV